MPSDHLALSLNQVRGAFSPEQTYHIPELTIKHGAQIALLGKSGSGKSTLLNLLSGMIGASDGSIKIHDQELVGRSEAARDKIRREHIGMIFQTYQLLPEFTVAENIQIGNYFSGQDQSKLSERITEILAKVDLAGYGDRYPNALSVGQQQRVAIARALIKQPAVLLADEPTGALDQETGSRICTLLQTLAKESGSTLIFVTHDQSLAQRFPSQLQVSDLLQWNNPEKKTA